MPHETGTIIWHWRIGVAFREWMGRVAEHDHRTVASLVEQAVVKYAKEIGVEEPPPARKP